MLLFSVFLITHIYIYEYISVDTCLLTMPAKNFTVGNLSCKFPSPVKFYTDRLEYVYMHPYNQSEILMLMYYKDLTNINMNNSGKFSFRVPKKLNLFPGMFVCMYVCMYVCM